uniref:Uncharacterized protein n=1 Tax=Meloidogyne incognita TaxID=6306 RepID=A0A914NTG0_MELIC
MYLSVRPPPIQQHPPIQQQQPLTKDIVNSNYLSVNNNQQRFGIGNSISLNAIRSGMIEKQQESQQQQDYANRNSLSRRYLQTNVENENNNKNNCVWKPNQNITKASMLVKKRRSSNLFNTSGGANKGGDEGGGEENGSFTAHHHQQQQQNHQSSLLLANSNSPCSSSQASTPSGCVSNDYRHSPPDGINSRLDDSKFGSGGGGGGGARSALNRIKQRRMAAAAVANNNSDLPPTIGRQTPSTHPPRSRSQSPSQLAMAILASEAAQAQ